MADNIWDLFWQSDTKDVELLWEYVLHIVTKAADVHSPLRRMKIRKNSPNWICKDIIAEIYYKDFLYKKAIESQDVLDWWIFRKQNSEVKLLVQHAKEDYIKDQLEQNENNPQKILAKYK